MAPLQLCTVPVAMVPSEDFSRELLEQFPSIETFLTSSELTFNLPDKTALNTAYQAVLKN